MNCCGIYSDRYTNGYPASEFNPGGFYPYSLQNHQNHHSSTSVYNTDYHNHHSYGTQMTNVHNYNYSQNNYNYQYEFSENSTYDAYRTLANRFPYYPTVFRETHPFNSEKHYTPGHHNFNGLNTMSSISKNSQYSSQNSLSDDAFSGISSSNYSNSTMAISGAEYPQSSTPSTSPYFQNRPFSRSKCENEEKTHFQKNHLQKKFSQISNENQSWLVNKCRNRKNINHTGISNLAEKIKKDILYTHTDYKNELPSKKSKRHSVKATPPEKIQSNIFKCTPLPGFQQAFGSTEIGRFSEAFFHNLESPAESDGDNPSPFWEGAPLEEVNLPCHYQFASEFTDSSQLGNCFSEISCKDL